MFCRGTTCGALPALIAGEDIIFAKFRNLGEQFSLYLFNSDLHFKDHKYNIKLLFCQPFVVATSEIWGSDFGNLILIEQLIFVINHYGS